MEIARKSHFGRMEEDTTTFLPNKSTLFHNRKKNKVSFLQKPEAMLSFCLVVFEHFLLFIIPLRGEASVPPETDMTHSSSPPPIPAVNRLSLGRNCPNDSALHIWK